jgi:hypothetical protein
VEGVPAARAAPAAGVRVGGRAAVRRLGQTRPLMALCCDWLAGRGAVKRLGAVRRVTQTHRSRLSLAADAC